LLAFFSREYMDGWKKLENILLNCRPLPRRDSISRPINSKLLGDKRRR
jgi:hypothetical protein